MTLKVIPLLQAFSSAIRRTFVQYFTGFQLSARRAVPQRQLGFLLMISVNLSGDRKAIRSVETCATIIVNGSLPEIGGDKLRGRLTNSGSFGKWLLKGSV